YAFVGLHGDPLARDISAQIETLDKQDIAAYSRRLLATSPHSIHAMGMLIGNDWPFAKPRIEEWRKTANDNAIFISALGGHYVNTQEYKEAESYLKRYIELVPEYWVYQMLADTYLKQGKNDLWKKTLDEFIDHGEDHGLNRASAQVLVADEFMKRKEWAKA